MAGTSSDGIRNAKTIRVLSRSSRQGLNGDRREDDRSEAAAAAEGFLAEAERLGGDLEQLVLANPLEGLLEVHHARRGEAHRLVGGRRADVGELLFLGDVDVEVVLAGVL